MHTMKRRDLPRGLATLFASMSVAACAHHDPADHVTGECKVALIGKCSSTQVETALSATDKTTLAPIAKSPSGPDREGGSHRRGSVAESQWLRTADDRLRRRARAG